MWEVSRWSRGAWGGDLGCGRCQGGAEVLSNTEFPVESLSTISLTHTGLAAVKCVGVESQFSTAGNQSIVENPPTFNERTRVPEPATLGVFPHPVLTQPGTDIPLSYLIAK